MREVRTHDLGRTLACHRGPVDAWTTREKQVVPAQAGDGRREMGVEGHPSPSLCSGYKPHVVLVHRGGGQHLPGSMQLQHPTRCLEREAEA